MSRPRRRSAEPPAPTCGVSAARDPGMRDRRVAILALAALVATTAIVYAGALGGELVLDARPLILDNPALRRLTVENVRTLLTTPYWHPLANDGLYRPATTLSYLANYAVLGNGGRPLGYHAVNLVLHLANVALVFALVAHLASGWRIALLAAAIFGLHPITTEAVTNVVGRADLLATLGILAGLHCHLRATRPRGSAWWTAGLAGSALVAGLSKESGLMLLPVLVLYDLVVAGGSMTDITRDRRRVAGYACAGLVALTVSIARAMAARAGHMLEDLSPIDNPIVEADFLRGRLTGIKAVGRELMLLVWPRTLSSDYSFDQVPVVRLPPVAWEDWQAIVALAAVIALAVVALRTFRARPALSFALLWGLATLLPTANVVAVIGSIMAERFLYLPLVGFAAAAALVGAPLLEGGPLPRRRLAWTLVVIALVALGWRTAVRNRDWRDDATLAARTVETAPSSAKAHRGYAATLFERDVSQERLAEVIGHAERAVAIRGDWIAPMLDLGRYYLVAAERVERDGEDPRPWYERAVAILERAREIDVRDNRRFAERIVASGRAGRGIPETGHLELYERLAVAYWRLGRRDDAITAMRNGMRLRPSDRHRYVELAEVLREVGRWEEAATAFFQALVLGPHDPQTTRDVVELYRRFDPDGGMLESEAPDAARLDLAHPTVRRHRCDGYRELAAIFARANLPAEAESASALHRRECGSE